MKPPKKMTEADVLEAARANGFNYLRAGDCPDVKRHTKHPEGYIAQMEWAKRKAKTHRQERCPTCGFWSLWTPRETP
jgi:hypothetical protein